VAAVAARVIARGAVGAARTILLGSGWWMVLACVAYASAALLVGSVVERVRSHGWGLGIRPEHVRTPEAP